MKCTFPHMGSYYIALKALSENLGLEVVVPPPITSKTIELGCKYSPEFACFPFKVNLGNFIESLDKGVDILLQSGTLGPCRYGYYGALQRKILEDLGYKFKLIKPFGDYKPQTVYRNFKSLKGVTNLKILRAFRMCWAKIKTIDEIEHLVRKIRAYEVNKGETTKIHQEFLKQLDTADTISEIKLVRQDFLKRFDNIKKDLTRKTLKIGIVGELYVVMEPACNHNLEEQLGEMGVEVSRPLCLTEMIRHALHFESKKLLRKIARPYLQYEIGAHATDSVAYTIMFAQKGFDGVIHIKPHACMPEVSAQAALYRVSRDYNIPILFFSFDEHTSSAGIQTRLEAFVDLLQAKRH